MAEATDTTTRARRRATSRQASTGAATGESGSQSGQFTCPECGRTFARAAALGAHRRSHGVAGRKSSAKRAGRRRRTSSTRSAATTRATTRTSGTPPAAGVDRNALLRGVFPSGVPASTEALSAVGAWLDEAERLAGMR
ncbi:MAG: C2H2-type zinc finger protein [Gaiellaceae bacterium]